MKDLSFKSIGDMLEEMAHAFKRAWQQGTGALLAMPWPQMLAACIALALILTIIPLALLLFTIFMIIKIVIAGAVVGARRAKDKERTIDGD